MNPSSVQFENGTPNFEYKKMYRCFPNKGNGLLFRMVNDKTSTWAFYNDTADSVMKVKGKFDQFSSIEAIGHARQESLEGGGVEVSVSVAPGATELFIRGKVNGFTMGFQTEVIEDSEAVSFINGTPSVPYNKVYKCFKNSENGLLFRLVDVSGKRWYFYNDTTDYIMKVTCEFEKKGSAQPTGLTKIGGTPANFPNGITLTLDVMPGKTEEFLNGLPQNYRLSFVAEAVDNDRPEENDKIKFLNGEPNWRLMDQQNTKLYRCFKEDGNGLLFRMVDERTKQWGFYNDTVDFSMKITLSFPEAEANVVQGTPDTVSHISNGKVEMTMTVPPLATMMMLRGLPSTYEISFAAESSNRLEPEESPKYRVGPPNDTVFPYDKVFRCFKDHSNGLMFRLVDERRNRWGFYNDTTDTTVTAKVSFGKDSKIEMLGTTKKEEDPEKGMIYSIIVKPQETLPFVQGKITSYVFEFTANKKVRN